MAVKSSAFASTHTFINYWNRRVFINSRYERYYNRNNNFIKWYNNCQSLNHDVGLVITSQHGLFYDIGAQHKHNLRQRITYIHIMSNKARSTPHHILQLVVLLGSMTLRFIGLNNVSTNFGLVTVHRKITIWARARKCKSETDISGSKHIIINNPRHPPVVMGVHPAIQLPWTTMWKQGGEMGNWCSLFYVSE